MVDVNITIKIPAVEKLLEYIASATGAVTRPMLERWWAEVTADVAQIEARGEAEARRIKARGQADTIDIIGKAIADARTSWPEREVLQGNVEMYDPSEIRTRLNFQEKKRNTNIYRVVKAAAESLRGRKVDNHEVDHDWTARFFEDVKYITSENMQQIWAKILAGEVEKPGRTSLHTLATLKNMTQHDAELFSKTSRFVFAHFIFWEEEHEQNIAGFPSLEELMKLESYSLMKIIPYMNNTITTSDSSRSLSARDRKAIYKISATGKEADVVIPGYALTPQGKQLYGFTEATLEPAYVRALAKFLSDKGFQLKQAQIIEEIDGNVITSSPWETIKF